MNQDRFETITRSLDTTGSRRELGRALAGGAVGALFGPGFGTFDADAKKQRHQKKKKPKFTTVTRTVRGPVTRTFKSTAPIAVPNTASVFARGNADPYPAVIDVTGFVNGVITDVNVTLQ